MKLYSYFRSSCSYRVRIALNHKNIDYEYAPVHLVNEGGEQLKKDFTHLNPKQEVPTLVHDGLTLSQSVAIFLYLDRIHLGQPLFPKEMPQFEKCFELVEVINSGIQPLQNLKVLKKLKSELGASDEQKLKWIKDFIFDGLKAYQNSLVSEGPYSMGVDVTAADMFLIPQMYNAHRFDVDMTELKRLTEIENNCLKLESFTKAHPSQQPDSPKTQK